MKKKQYIAFARKDYGLFEIWVNFLGKTAKEVFDDTIKTGYLKIENYPHPEKFKPAFIALLDEVDNFDFVTKKKRERGDIRKGRDIEKC